MAKEKQNSVRILQATAKKNTNKSSFLVFFGVIGSLAAACVALFSYYHFSAPQIIEPSHEVSENESFETKLGHKSSPDVDDIAEDNFPSNLSEKELANLFKHKKQESKEAPPTPSNSPFSTIFGIEKKVEAKPQVQASAKPSTNSKPPATSKPTSTIAKTDDSAKKPDVATQQKVVEEEFVPEASLQISVTKTPKEN